jgi:hypothetical protein
MNSSEHLLDKIGKAFEIFGIAPTQFILTVSIAEQTVSLFEQNKFVKKFSCSTFISSVRQTTAWLHKILFQFLHKHFGISSALLVFFAARGRQIVGRAFAEAAFGLKISERLRREREQFIQI